MLNERSNTNTNYVLNHSATETERHHSDDFFSSCRQQKISIRQFLLQPVRYDDFTTMTIFQWPKDLITDNLRTTLRNCPEKILVSIQISLKCVPRGPSDNTVTLALARGILRVRPLIFAFLWHCWFCSNIWSHRLNHVPIWQASPSLRGADACQIWPWYMKQVIWISIILKKWMNEMTDLVL